MRALPGVAVIDEGALGTVAGVTASVFEAGESPPAVTAATETR
jgi:hypothetical protein